MQSLISNTSRCHTSSADDLDNIPGKKSAVALNSGPSSLPPQHTAVRPNTLPQLDLQASSPRLTNGSTTAQAPANSGHGVILRGQSLHGGAIAVSARSRSQVTRCASEGGDSSQKAMARNPSASPRRPMASDRTSLPSSRGVLEQSDASQKSNFLNFSKFGVKFSKPKEETEQTIPPADTSKNIPKQLEILRKKKPMELDVDLRKPENLPLMLQKLAGELNGHLSALNLRHDQLKLGSDMAISVTMESLRHVSASLQQVADGLLSSCKSSSNPLDTPKSAPLLAHPLQHPLMSSPD